ncbi:MAG: MarR family transcriptional regulator [Alphaproteobacteria bacterium]|nr:MarR family transcriptional regulator [Alphaproteobacteria bacterium]
MSDERRRGAAESFEIEAYLPYRLGLVAHRLGLSAARDYFSRFGIGLREWLVLTVLGRGGPQTAQAIVGRAALDKATVSRAIAVLADRGLVERGGDPADARRQPVALSESGRLVFEALLPQARARAARLVAALDDDERARLDGILAKLLAATDAMLADDERSGARSRARKRRD